MTVTGSCLAFCFIIKNTIQTIVSDRFIDKNNIFSYEMDYFNVTL